MKAEKEQQTETIASWLLCHIEAFMDLNDMEPDGTSFGWASVKDCSLVTRLRDGGDVRLSNMEKILSFMQHPVSQTGKNLNLKPITIKRRNLP